MTLYEALSLAVIKMESGNFSEAESICDSILEKFPEDKLTLFIKSLVSGSRLAESEGSIGQRRLLNSFKKHQSHYAAMPDYNLNWAIVDFSPVHEFLKTNPLVIIDIGARGASLGEIENLKQYCMYYGFDADDAECRRVNDNPPKGFYGMKMLPYYVGGKDDELIKFHLYKSRGQSSKLLPSSRFSNLFDRMEVDFTLDLKSMTLDSILQNEGIDCFDFIKLDTQGTELDILSSSPNSIQKALLIESEVEFIEMYQGQPLFGEFFSFMNDQGFDLLYLNRVFQNRMNYDGPARGQVTFCDALFVKRECFYKNFDELSLAKNLIMLINYGHLDLAFQIWSNSRDMKILLPNLDVYFKKYVANADRLRKMSVDKLLAWSLHNRTTNQLPFDSDRSWPVR